MCGIAGEVTWGGRRPDPLIGASRALIHRGPDDEGAWSDERCTVVNRRLAVIDPTAAGHQPMVSRDGRFVLTFNGEIFNHRELRAELESRGSAFRSGSDTEVLLEAYREWGPSCLPRLDGMFAFAVWDTEARALFLARDRLGEKPLFHSTAGDRFRFASTVAALRADGGIDSTPDLLAVDDHLTWGYAPAPRTAFLGIERLAPGHWLRVEVGSGRPVTSGERWWDVRYGPKLEVDEAEAAAAVREAITTAVRRRAISDVPTGAFLSGGIDSTVVVGLLAEASDRPVPTFTAGFDVAALDERAHARRVAARFGTDHHEVVIEPPTPELVVEQVRHHGEPFADASSVPTWCLARAARQDVTVVLTGDGGDESFAGYPRHRAHRLAERSPVDDGLTPIARHLRWTALVDDRLKRDLYRPELLAVLDPARAHAHAAALCSDVTDPLDQALALDTRGYLPGDLLPKADVATMAHGLEARAPFVDHHVVELAARLPGDLKLRGSRSKHVLLEATPDLVPPENAQRPKMGFSGPLAEWLRGPLLPFLRDVLVHGDRDSWFDRARVGGLVEEHVSGRVDHANRLWALLMVELWRQLEC